MSFFFSLLHSISFERYLFFRFFILGKAPPPKTGAKPPTLGPKPGVKPSIPNTSNGTTRSVPTPPSNPRTVPSAPKAPVVSKAPSTPSRVTLGGGEARPPGAGDLAAALARRGRPVVD